MKTPILVSFVWISVFLLSCSKQEREEYMPRTILLETNGTSRVLIQQLDPPADILVKEMKAGERAEVVVRGPCKLFCSAREFVQLDNNGTMVEITDDGPGVIEF
jgi:hypothetical protein